MSAGREIFHDVKVAQVLAPATYKAAQSPAAIDMNGFEALTLVMSVGTITDGTFGVTLQDSDDGTNYAAVDPSNILSAGEPAQGVLPTGLATGVGNGSNTIQEFAYIGQKRYVQVALTVSGAPATGAQMCMTALLGSPRHAPVL